MAFWGSRSASFFILDKPNRCAPSRAFRRYTILKYSYSCCCCTLARARNNKAAGRCGFQKNGFPKTQAARYDGSFLPVRTRESNQGRPGMASMWFCSETKVPQTACTHPELPACYCLLQSTPTSPLFCSDFETSGSVAAEAAAAAAAAAGPLRSVTNYPAVTVRCHTAPG